MVHAVGNILYKDEKITVVQLQEEGGRYIINTKYIKEKIGPIGFNNENLPISESFYKVLIKPIVNPKIIEYCSCFDFIDSIEIEIKTSKNNFCLGIVDGENITNTIKTFKKAIDWLEGEL